MNCFDPTNPFGYMPELPDDLTPEERDRLTILYPLCGCATMGAVFSILMLLCLLFGSCTTTKYVPVETTRTDTLYISRAERDSIYLHDSIHVTEQQRGDTLYIMHDRWHTQYRDRLQHDTIYHTRRDTIPQPYEVIREVKVDKPLTWWQQLRIHTGGIAIWLILLFGCCKIWQWRKKVG